MLGTRYHQLNLRHRIPSWSSPANLTTIRRLHHVHPGRRAAGRAGGPPPRPGRARNRIAGPGVQRGSYPAPPAVRHEVRGVRAQRQYQGAALENHQPGA